MKIVICGAASSFASYLIDKFVCEAHTVFHFTDQDSPFKSLGGENVTVCNMALSDPETHYVMAQVAPEVVIFLGAHDENYNWDGRDAHQSRFLSTLTNLLMAAAPLRVNRFIYLSDYSVYGAGEYQSPDEYTPPGPDDVRGVLIAEGERICLNFNHVLNSNAVVMRLNGIYGPSYNRDQAADPLAERCREACAAGKLVVADHRQAQYTFVEDATDAVFRLATAISIGQTIYNATGGPVVSDQAIAQHIWYESQQLGRGIEMVHESTRLPAVGPGAVDNGKFCSCFGYREGTDIQTGIGKTYRWAVKNSAGIVGLLPKQEPPAPQGKRERRRLSRAAKPLFKRVLPVIEHLLLLVLAVALTEFTRTIPYLCDLDYLLLFYVLPVALLFGKRQALPAVFASALAVVLERFFLRPAPFDFDLFVGLFTLLAVGLPAGHLCDNMRDRTEARDEMIAYRDRKIVELTELHQTTLKTKTLLEDRLLNEDDSLARIDSIVSELEDLLPQKILVNAVNVIMRVMGSDSVAVYSCHSGGYSRLVAASASLNGHLAKSMRCGQMEDISDVLGRREVYVNKSLDKDLPLMAAPIYHGDELMAVIMIWRIGFGKLTSHQANLLAMLAKMITRSIERASAYEQAAKHRMLADGACIYTEAAMLDFLNIAKENFKLHETPYTLLAVDETGRARDELGAQLARQLRTYDYLGLLNGRLTVLLSNTSAEESEIFIKRIVDSGVAARVLLAKGA